MSVSSTPSLLVIYDQNSHVLEISGLKRLDTGAYITDISGVTVSADIAVKNSDPVVIVALSSISLTFVPASAGIWRGTFRGDLALVMSGRYVARITADGGPVLKGYFEPDLVVRRRVR